MQHVMACTIAHHNRLPCVSSVVPAEPHGYLPPLPMCPTPRVTEGAVGVDANFFFELEDLFF